MKGPGCFASLRSGQGTASLTPLGGYPLNAKGVIYIRTHNTDLKNRLTAYAAAHPGECRQTDADPDTGCMEFEIRKGRFSFRLTAPYSAERRWAAIETAKKRIKGF